MKPLLMIAVLAFSVQLPFPAFAGRSLEVLNCHGDGADGFGPINASVFYEVKAGSHGEFGDFLGFQANAMGLQNDGDASFYCFGGCTLEKRKIVEDEIEIVVEDKSLVSPALDQKYILTVPTVLLKPGVEASGHIRVDLMTYKENSTVMPVSADVDCTSGEGAAFLLNSKR